MTNRLFGTAKLLSGVFKASILSFIAIFAFAVYDFVLPLFVQESSKNFAVVGIVVSLVYVASLLAEVPIGHAVDRYGRVRVLVVAMAALGALGILYFFSNGAIQLAVLSLVAGVISVAFWVPSTVLVRDFSPRKMLAQSEGVYLTITQLGWIAGPIVAGLISLKFADKYNFLFFAFLMFAAVGAAFLIFRGKDVRKFREIEKKHRHQSRIKLLITSFVKYMQLHKHAMPLYILSMTAYMWISLEWSFIAIAGMNRFGFSEIVVGILIGAMMAIEGILYLTSGYLMDKVGTKYIITSGFFLLFATSYFIFLANTPSVFMFAVLMSAGATSWILPGTESLLTKIVPANIMGEMSSVFDTSKDFGLIIGPLLAGVIASQLANPQSAFALVFVSSAAACLFSGYIFWPDKSYK